MKKIFLIILFLLVNFIFAKNIQNGQIIKTKTFLLDTAMDSNTVYHYAIGYHDTIFTVIWKHGSDSLRLKRFSKITRILILLLKLYCRLPENITSA